jgi:DNA repair ATPase RecN
VIDVEIKDFQSIERVVLTIDGFTALLGRSNIGKSAVIRAMKAALTGSAGTAFVRHGPSCARRVKKTKTCKCFSSVHLRGKDFDLLWEKGDAINRYTYNGQVYDRAERGVPEFLLDKFALVKVGDDQKLLQCSDQFYPIFLLDQTGGVVAEVLSDAARLDRINVAMKLAEKDRREAVSVRKVREQDLTLLAEKIGRFDGLDNVLSEVQATQDSLVKLGTAQQTMAQIEGFISTASNLKGEAPFSNWRSVLCGSKGSCRRYPGARQRFVRCVGSRTFSR